MHRPEGARKRAGAILAAALAALATACGSDGTKKSRAPTPREFALVQAERPAQGAETAPEPLAAPVTGPVAASEGILDIRALPGPPPVAPSEPERVEAAALIEATVGTINGRPVYASAFLEDLSGTLRAKGEELAARPRGAEEWRAYAREAIGRKLNGMIADELFRAEALASLTPEQKQGLFAFLERMQREEVSRTGGSIEAARRRVAEESEGLSLDQYLQQREQRELIGYELQRKIRRGVNVTWRDIRFEYERSAREFHPEPRAVFRMIQVPASEEADGAEVGRRLAAGEHFEAVAESALNRNEPASGGRREVTVRGEPAEPVYFASPVLNEAARGLEPGAWAGPVDLGPMKAWLYLERLEQGGTPLYDAQRTIHERLTQARLIEARDKYLSRLITRANITNPDQMIARLVTIAEERFLKQPPSR